MPTKPATLTRGQTELALFRLDPFYAYRWLDADEYEWRGVEQPDGTYDLTAPVPTDAALVAAWDAYAAEQAQAAADQQAAETERTAAGTDLAAQYQAAIARLDQIRTQMATIAGATFANNAQRDAAIKQVAAGVDDEALILKRTLRLAKAALT